MVLLPASRFHHFFPKETSSPTKSCVMTSSHAMNPKQRDTCCLLDLYKFYHLPTWVKLDRLNSEMKLGSFHKGLLDRNNGEKC